MLSEERRQRNREILADHRLLVSLVSAAVFGLIGGGLGYLKVGPAESAVLGAFGFIAGVFGGAAFSIEYDESIDPKWRSPLYIAGILFLTAFLLVVILRFQ